MRCQQRAKRRCPRYSSDVLEADLPPPADALELLPKRLWRTSIAVGQSAFYPGQFMPREALRILAEYKREALARGRASDGCIRSLLLLGHVGPLRTGNLSRWQLPQPTVRRHDTCHMLPAVDLRRLAGSTRNAYRIGGKRPRRVDIGRTATWH